MKLVNSQLIAVLLLCFFVQALALETTKPVIARSREGEFLIDTNVVFIPDTNSQYNPSASFDGTHFLVVWEDDRNGNWDVFGARVDSTGNIIDPVAIPISTASGDQRNPSVYFGSPDYLVVWEDARNYTWDIYGARVNQAGVVLDPTGIAISSANDIQWRPAVAFDGGNYLVVWEDWRCGAHPPRYQIYGARVNQAGILIDPDGIMISPFYEASPAIVFDGEYYFVVWHRIFGHPPDWSRVEGIHVDTAGMIVGSTTYIPHQFFFGSYPSLAFDGTNYFVSMLGFIPDSAFVYGARVDKSGNVLDTLGIVIAGLQPQWGLFSSVAFDGMHYVTAWNDFLHPAPGDIYGATTSRSGVVIDSFAVSTQPGDQGPPALTSDIDGQVLIVYSGWTDSINCNLVNRMRIWGKFYSFVGVIEDFGNEDCDFKCNLTIYPNPFSMLTNIKFGEMHGVKDVELRIIDATGRSVRQWDCRTFEESRCISWNGRDDSGRELPNGVYFVILQADDYIDTERLLVIR